MTLIIYLFSTANTLKVNRIDNILPYMKRIDKYYPLIPFSIISIGFLLMTFVIFNKFFLNFGMILTILGMGLFYIMLLIKTHYENKIFYTLNRANKILSDFDVNNKNIHNIKQFNKYFVRFLYNIDRNLNKGIKINNLTKDDRKSSKEATIDIAIKNTIIHYLPVFIKFGNKEQIDSFKNHLNAMETLVNQNDEFDLNITSIILDIYKDIEDFLYLHKYPVTEQRWRINLSLFKDRDLLYFLFGIIQTVVFIIYIVISGKANL